MQRAEMTRHVAEVCREMDASFKRWKGSLLRLTLPLALPAALGVSVTVAACSEDAYGPGACEDDIDNDNDGETDCEDEDCQEEPPCMMDLYAAPF